MVVDYKWIAICILFILVIFRPKLSGYADSGKSIFDLDEFSWIPGIYDIRDLINDDFIVNLKSLTKDYNSGNYQRLTKDDYTNLVLHFNKMVDSFNAKSPSHLTGNLIPPPGSNAYKNTFNNAVAGVQKITASSSSSVPSSGSSGSWSFISQKNVWIPLVVFLVLLIIGVAVAMSSHS